MTGQGKQMPGMAARDSQDDDAAPSAAPAAAADHAAPSTTDGDGFDTWLRGELTRLYGGALDEPVPDDMMRLLQDAARRSPG